MEVVIIVRIICFFLSLEQKLNIAAINIYVEFTLMGPVQIFRSHKIKRWDYEFWLSIELATKNKHFMHQNILLTHTISCKYACIQEWFPTLVLCYQEILMFIRKLAKQQHQMVKVLAQYIKIFSLDLGLGFVHYIHNII